MNFVELLQYHPVREAMSKVYERMDSQSFARVMHVLDHHDWSKYSNPTAMDLANDSPTPVSDLLSRMPGEADEADEEGQNKQTRQNRKDRHTERQIDRQTNKQPDK